MRFALRRVKYETVVQMVYNLPEVTSGPQENQIFTDQII